MKIRFVGLLTVLVAGWFFLVTQAAAQEKKASVKTPDRLVTWCISVNKAPNAVRAFGFDIIYPTDMLTFSKASKGKLLEKGFGYFGVNELKPGRIRVGGMEPGEHNIAKEASGRLVTLTFIRKKEAAPVFKIILVRDDMQSWSLSVNGDAQAAHLSLTECENP